MQQLPKRRKSIVFSPEPKPGTTGGAGFCSRQENGKSPAKAGAGDANGARVVKSLEELRQWEDFYAYPGPVLLNLAERAHHFRGRGRHRARWRAPSALPL